MNCYLFGWDMDQWAIATAVINPVGYTAKDAIRVKLEWIRRYGNDPGGVEFECVKREMNWDAVNKLLSINGWVGA